MDPFLSVGFPIVEVPGHATNFAIYTVLFFFLFSLFFIIILAFILRGFLLFSTKSGCFSFLRLDCQSPPSVSLLLVDEGLLLVSPLQAFKVVLVEA